MMGVIYWLQKASAFTRIWKGQRSLKVKMYGFFFFFFCLYNSHLSLCTTPLWAVVIILFIATNVICSSVNVEPRMQMHLSYTYKNCTVYTHLSLQGSFEFEY